DPRSFAAGHAELRRPDPQRRAGEIDLDGGFIIVPEAIPQPAELPKPRRSTHHGAFVAKLDLAVASAPVRGLHAVKCHHLDAVVFHRERRLPHNATLVRLADAARTKGRARAAREAAKEAGSERRANVGSKWGLSD